MAREGPPTLPFLQKAVNGYWLMLKFLLSSQMHQAVGSSGQWLVQGAPQAKSDFQ